jgi:uncharacterized protein (TIGR00730 family)
MDSTDDPRDAAAEPRGHASPEDHRRLEAILASSSYQIAYEDGDFLMRDEMRGSRLELEFLKPDLVLRDHQLSSTIVVFGGTRVIEPRAARERLTRLEASCATRPDDPLLARELSVARRLVAKSHYYDVARELGRLVAEHHRAGTHPFTIITGGGPGIMEAANRGAYEAGGQSIGLNITLPHEQVPNAFITPDLCFQFRYFAIRKMHFMLRAKALVVFPGGYGTLDELFDALTLVQTRRVTPLPIILCGRSFWRSVLHLEHLADEGTIAYEDLELFTYAETAQEIWEAICSFHADAAPARD